MTKFGEIPLLEGTNYATWKSSVQTVLKRYGCWEIVEGIAVVGDFPADGIQRHYCHQL